MVTPILCNITIVWITVVLTILAWTTVFLSLGSPIMLACVFCATKAERVVFSILGKKSPIVDWCRDPAAVE